MIEYRSTLPRAVYAAAQAEGEPGLVGLGLGTLVGALVGHRDVVELAGDN